MPNVESAFQHCVRLCCGRCTLIWTLNEQQGSTAIVHCGFLWFQQLIPWAGCFWVTWYAQQLCGTWMTQVLLKQPCQSPNIGGGGGVIVHEEHDRHAQPQITSQALLTQTAHLLYTFIHLWVYLGSSWCSLTSTHSRVKHLIVPNVCTGMHAEHSSRWTQRLYIDSFCIIPYVLIINFVQSVKKLCFLFWMPKCITSIITLPSVICDAER